MTDCRGTAFRGKRDVHSPFGNNLWVGGARGEGGGGELASPLPQITWGLMEGGKERERGMRERNEAAPNI